MKWLIVFAVMSLSVAASERPVIGKFDINSAKCDGEDFLWKKHDQVIISQKVIAFEGKLEETESSLCRFQDVYKRNSEKKTVFTSKSRNILCWKTEASEKVGRADVSVESFSPKSLYVEAKSSSHGAKLSVEGSELCEGKLQFDLSIHVQ